MPYRNIHWIKLEKRLLNDYRFYTLSDPSQLIYMKLLMLAGDTNNKIPKKMDILGSSLRSTLKPAELEKCLQEIKSNFPKFKETKHFYQFVGWNKRHNQVIPRIALDSPQESLDKIREDKIRKEKNRGILEFFSEQHKEAIGVAYPPDYGKDKKIIYDLMSIYDDKTLRNLIKGFFNGAKDPNEWWFDKTLNVGMFKVMIPQIIVRLRRKKE